MQTEMDDTKCTVMKKVITQSDDNKWWQKVIDNDTKKWHKVMTLSDDKSVMTQSDDTLWWHMLMTQTYDTNLWHDFLTLSDEKLKWSKKWWHKVMEKWWHNMMKQFDEAKWWHKVMAQRHKHGDDTN